MALAYVQALHGPIPNAIPVYNTSTTVTISANQAVIVDASNIMDDAGVKNQLAVTLPTDTSNPSVIIGQTLTSIPPGQTGTLVPSGSGLIALGVCDGAVTAGTLLDNSTTSTKTGRVKTHTAGKYSYCIALATGADGDTIPILMCGVAANA